MRQARRTSSSPSAAAGSKNAAAAQQYPAYLAVTAAGATRPVSASTAKRMETSFCVIVDTARQDVLGIPARSTRSAAGFFHDCGPTLVKMVTGKGQAWEAKSLHVFFSNADALRRATASMEACAAIQMQPPPPPNAAGRRTSIDVVQSQRHPGLPFLVVSRDVLATAFEVDADCEDARVQVRIMLESLAPDLVVPDVLPCSDASVRVFFHDERGKQLGVDLMESLHTVTKATTFERRRHPSILVERSTLKLLNLSRCEESIHELFRDQFLRYVKETPTGHFRANFANYSVRVCVCVCCVAILYVPPH